LLHRRQRPVPSPRLRWRLDTARRPLRMREVLVSEENHHVVNFDDIQLLSPTRGRLMQAICSLVQKEREATGITPSDILAAMIASTGSYITQHSDDPVEVADMFAAAFRKAVRDQVNDYKSTIN